MKIYSDDGGLRIEPEDAMDRAYMRDVLGLKRDGDRAEVRYVQPPLSAAEYAAVQKREGGE